MFEWNAIQNIKRSHVQTFKLQAGFQTFQTFKLMPLPKQGPADLL